METRRLGRTGHQSSVAILGAAAFWGATPEQAEAGFELALSRGVNHLDIAPSYGVAEDVVGPLVPAVRDALFVACKTNRHNPDGVRTQLEVSLTKLGVDRFDLYQTHGVTDLAELDSRSEAIEAILAARDEGLTRWVGITGHDLGTPAAQLEALRRWDLDTVMFPVYARVWADPVYRADAEALLAEAAVRDVGVMAIKVAARRPWGDRELTAGTWYEPWTTPWPVERGVRFTLSTPGVHGFCTPGDLEVLPLALDAAERYEPLTDANRAEIMEAVADAELIFPLAEKARR
jgi:aryl-alcohol dehydrogenase-like predicted oxidoreductase